MIIQPLDISTTNLTEASETRTQQILRAVPITLLPGPSADKISKKMHIHQHCNPYTIYYQRQHPEMPCSYAISTHRRLQYPLRATSQSALPFCCQPYAAAAVPETSVKVMRVCAASSVRVSVRLGAVPRDCCCWLELAGKL